MKSRIVQSSRLQYGPGEIMVATMFTGDGDDICYGGDRRRAAISAVFQNQHRCGIDA